FGTGALTSLAGIPGDILQLGSNIAGGLGLQSKDALTPEQRQNSIKHWQDKLKKLNPNTNEYTQAQEIIQNLQEGDQPVQFPTGDVLKREIINPAVKGTTAEKFVTPQDDLDEFLQDIGGTTALLTNPTRNVPTLLKNTLKAAGVAVGGDALGWMTKNVTGSDKLGNAIKNGTYLLYSLFPGLPGRLGQKSYSEYTDKVINPAIEQGKVVDMKPYKEMFNDIGKKIDNRFTQTSDASHFLRNEAAKVQDMMGYNSQINPDALWNNIKEMGSYFDKVPDQAKGVFQELIELQKKALKDFSNTIIPNGGKLLENANDFWRTSHAIADDLAFVKQVSNPRNYGAGALFWLSGGFPLVMKASMGEAGRRFASRMFQSPAVRESITQLAKASSAQNASLVNKMITRLDKETETILSKMSAQDQRKIRAALEQANQNQ